MMTWSAVDREVNNRFTVVTKYQVFRSEPPYLTIAPTPRTGNLVEEPTDLDPSAERFIGANQGSSMPHADPRGAAGDLDHGDER
jgi:hypothetical protein